MSLTSRRARRAIVPLLAGVACAACSSGAAVTPRGEVVDSAGVRVVTYDLTGVETPVHRTVAAHDLEIGSAAGAPEVSFSRIVDLAETRHGALVVSDGLERELRIYDEDGGFVRRLGQEGEGPGEFSSAPTIAGLSGDTVFAFDVGSSRVTVFTLGGVLVEATTLRGEGIGRPRAVLRLDDGTYLSQSDWVDRSGTVSFHDVRLELDSLVIEHLDPTGSLLDTVRVMADRNRLRTVRDRGGGMVSVLQSITPFAARTFMRSDGVRPLVGRSDDFALEMLDPDGRARTVLRVRGAEHPATAADIRAHQEARVRAEMGDGPIDPMVRRVNLDHLPDRLPAFGDIVVAADGDVWMSRMDFDAEEGTDWLVFSADGQLRGTVHTPPDMRLFAVRTDHVVGVVTDDLDVPYVRRYPLAPPGPGG